MSHRTGRFGFLPRTGILPWVLLPGLHGAPVAGQEKAINSLEQGLEITRPPSDMPWHVREMHVRHPDGPVFRISRGIMGGE